MANKEGERAVKKRKLEHKGYEDIDWKNYGQVGQEDVCAHHSGKLKTRSLKSIMNQTQDNMITRSPTQENWKIKSFL